MRDEKLDVLRFIGLAMIILAHVNPSPWLFQLRNFDVPLMVLVSGVAFGLSYRKEAYHSYVWKRVKRLLLPAWVFLTVYFFVMYLFSVPKPLPDVEKVWESFLLMKGIGYVWIIRVFLLVALIAPFVLNFNDRVKSNWGYFVIVAVLYGLYELTLHYVQPSLTSAFGIFIQNTLFYVIPYGIIFSLGLRFMNLPSLQLIAPAFLFALVFAMIAIGLYWKAQEIVYTQAFKYPPQLYYLSYALAVSLIVWCLVDWFMPYLKILILYPVIEFIARNSLWAYLWHIPFVDLFWFEYYYKYPLVFACACIMTYIQVFLVSSVLIPTLKNQALKKNIKLIFTG